MEARHWVPEGERIRCRLCPRQCLIAPGGMGACRTRVHRHNRLEVLNYGQVTSVALDPIEKKPLYHFHPGKTVLSVGTFGCNLTCRYCQNYAISQLQTESREIAPADLVAAARKQGSDCIGLAYTYSEPSVWYEHVLETARLAKDSGLANVLVTNGYMAQEPLHELLPFIDAANVDVKAFTDDFYRDVCGGTLGPVLETAATMKTRVHLELTTLLISGLNDSEEEITRLVDWVVGLGSDTPLHFSRYHPTYRMNLPATPIETMVRAQTIARRKLHYVYLGNVPPRNGQDTSCPQCGAILIHRLGWSIRIGSWHDGRCMECGRETDLTGAPA